MTATRTGSGQVTVAWIAPVDDGGLAITGFPIGYESDGVTSSSVCSAATGNYTNSTDSGAAGGTSEAYSGLTAPWYCVRISADNGVTTGSPNYAYAGPVRANVTRPQAPTGVTATRTGGGAVTVAWTPPVDDGGQSITGFPIGYESDGVTSSSDCSATTGNYTNATDSGAAADTSEANNGLTATWYCVRISADNGVTTGSPNYAYAGPVRANATKPGPPQGVSASGGKGRITTEWTAPADDGGQALTGYTVQFEDDSITSTTACGSTLSYDDASATAGALATSVVKSGLLVRWYCLRVFATNGVTSGATNYAY